MSARISSMELQEVIGQTADNLTTFITTANLIVSEDLTGKGMSDARLKQIELYLAAHYARRNILTEKLGDATTSYDSTSFLDKAIGLDSSGTLLRNGQQQTEFELL